MRTTAEVQAEVDRLEQLTEEARGRGEDMLGTFFSVQADAVVWGSGGDAPCPSAEVEKTFANFKRTREERLAAVHWRDSSNTQRESYTAEVAGCVQLMAYRVREGDARGPWFATWGHGAVPLAVYGDAHAARRAALEVLGEWALKLMKAVPV